MSIGTLTVFARVLAGILGLGHLVGALFFASTNPWWFFIPGPVLLLLSFQPVTISQGWRALRGAGIVLSALAIALQIAKALHPEPDAFTIGLLVGTMAILGYFGWMTFNPSRKTP